MPMPGHTPALLPQANGKLDVGKQATAASLGSTHTGSFSTLWPDDQDIVPRILKELRTDVASLKGVQADLKRKIEDWMDRAEDLGFSPAFSPAISPGAGRPRPRAASICSTDEDANLAMDLVGHAQHMCAESHARERRLSGIARIDSARAAALAVHPVGGHQNGEVHRSGEERVTRGEARKQTLKGLHLAGVTGAPRPPEYDRNGMSRACSESSVKPDDSSASRTASTVQVAAESDAMTAKIALAMGSAGPLAMGSAGPAPENPAARMKFVTMSSIETAKSDSRHVKQVLNTSLSMTAGNNGDRGLFDSLDDEQPEKSSFNIYDLRSTLFTFAHTAKEVLLGQPEKMSRRRLAGLQSESPEPLTGFGKVDAVVNSGAFKLMASIMNILNAVFIGMEVQYEAGLHSEPSNFLRIANIFWCAWFCIEIVLRITADRGLPFFFNDERHWNRFEAVIVIVSIIEVVSDAGRTDGSPDISILRQLRIVRVFRTLRAFLVLRFFRQLQILFLSILGTLQSLFWTAMLLALILYIFGVTFTQGVAGHLRERLLSGVEPSDLDADLREFYGSIPRSIFTLFRGMSNGQSWNEYAAPLAEISWFFVGLFIAFIVFTIFALMNVVTGVFVESALASAQEEKDALIRDELENKRTYMRKIRDLFLEIDTNDSGTISKDEFFDALDDEQMKAYFRMLNMEISETAQFFELLDVDDSGVVGIDEFAQGCMKLKGEAKCIHIAALSKTMCMLYTAQQEQLAMMEERLGHSIKCCHDALLESRGQVAMQRRVLPKVTDSPLPPLPPSPRSPPPIGRAGAQPSTALECDV